MGPSACQDHFRRLKSHRVHALRAAFSCLKNECRKARERGFATIDENRRAVGMLNPMRYKEERYVPGGGRVGTCDHGLSGSW